MTLLLTGLSIYGAFLGAEKSQTLFNSLPLVFYWVLFAILLIVGIVAFPRLLRIPGLLLTHIGCVLVLAGGILGSQKGIGFQDRLFGTDTIRTGQMLIQEGMTVDTVEMEDQGTKPLPFAVRLVDFRMEYYEPGTLAIQTPDGTLMLPAKVGSIYMLTPELGTIEIVRQYERFKLRLQDGNRVPIDDPQGQLNPALELVLIRPDGSRATQYVFERFPEFAMRRGDWGFLYSRTVRDYISDLEVVDNSKVLTRKSIEVNKPLHFGGYYFYQHSYDDQAGRFTVLRVASDRGLWIVYAGYFLLCAGMFWHLWLRHLLKRQAVED